MQAFSASGAAAESARQPSHLHDSAFLSSYYRREYRNKLTAYAAFQSVFGHSHGAEMVRNHLSYKVAFDIPVRNGVRHIGEHIT